MWQENLATGVAFFKSTSVHVPPAWLDGSKSPRKVLGFSLASPNTIHPHNTPATPKQAAALFFEILRGCLRASCAESALRPCHKLSKSILLDNSMAPVSWGLGGREEGREGERAQMASLSLLTGGLPPLPHDCKFNAS